MPVITDIDQELLERVKKQYNPDDLGKILKRVRQFTAKAEAEIAPGATPEERAAATREQELARGMADALMFAFNVSQAQAEATMPASARSKPSTLLLGVGAYAQELTPWISTMLEDLARHCRCKLRHYAQYDNEEHQYLTKVYGFESDLRYLEILYTTIRLHMIGAFLPKIDETQTLDENCFRLHEAGRNWLEIAEIYGWRKASGHQVYEYAEAHDKDPYKDFKVPYYNKDSGEVKPATQVGGIFKRAYLRECKRLGKEPTQISASSSEAFRRSAAQGYVYRLRQRLQTVERSRDTSTSGAGIVLRTRYEDVLDFFRKDNPDLFQVRESEPAPRCEKCEKAKSGHCRDHPAGRAWKPQAHSEAGWRAGARHADTADLSGGRNAPGGHHRALG